MYKMIVLSIVIICCGSITSSSAFNDKVIAGRMDLLKAIVTNCQTNHPQDNPKATAVDCFVCRDYQLMQCQATINLYDNAAHIKCAEDQSVYRKCLDMRVNKQLSKKGGKRK